MNVDALNVVLGFIEGLSLIISPCILPILPIILVGSLSGNKKRPLAIIAGFVLVFSLVTFFSRKIVQLTGLDFTLIRHVSFCLLFLLGIVMVSQYLTSKLSQLTQKIAQSAGGLIDKNRSKGDFIGGLIMGGLIALVWTPCAGPVLAAVIVQTVLQQTNFMSFLVLFAFTIGAGIPMLLISLYGQDVMTRLAFFKKHASAFRKTLGIILMLSILYMVRSESSISPSLPESLTLNDKAALLLEKGLLKPYPAPPIAGITAWINTEPLTESSLKGKVVLIDFWTYSCINCIRTLPYLKAWYEKYHDKGLIIIGVHAPEFEFEKNLSSVKVAVKLDGLLYPIALDNQFVTWRNFNNHYWPAHYLINKQGDVVYTHFGEGDYDVTENNIQYLLGLVEPRDMKPPTEAGFQLFQTPETYLGYERADPSNSPTTLTQNTVNATTFPEQLPQNHWALQGRWTIMADKILAEEANAALKIHFRAHKVYIVMGSSTGKPIPVKLTFNGQAVLITEQGTDVLDSSILVKRHQLYQALALPNTNGGELEVTSTSPGLEVYTLTFGD